MYPMANWATGRNILFVEVAGMAAQKGTNSIKPPSRRVKICNTAYNRIASIGTTLVPFKQY